MEQFLGGGMSRVYRAKDTVLGRDVAIKILSEGCDADAQARFLQEARLACTAKHENVIAVYDFGEDQGQPYMVMELLEGESLRRILDRKTPGDFKWKIRVALQVARAIEYIHSRKIVHRDIKPENVYIDGHGHATLMDFGIAKTEGFSLTKAGFTLGTPFYMAPEQVVGGPVTAQADVYAFGVVLYELLTGLKPVQGDNFEQVFDRILTQPLPQEPLVEAKIPPLVIDLIARCTAKPPAARPQGLGAICGQLETLLDPAQHSVRRSPEMPLVTKRVEPPPKPEDNDMPGLLRILPAPFRSQVGLGILSALVVLALAVAVLRLTHLL
ncbi:MAG: serine/threonine-protein kinase [Bryobacteraceae bacterium]